MIKHALGCWVAICPVLAFILGSIDKEEKRRPSAIRNFKDSAFITTLLVAWVWILIYLFD